MHNEDRDFAIRLYAYNVYLERCDAEMTQEPRGKDGELGRKLEWSEAEKIRRAVLDWREGERRFQVASRNRKWLAPMLPLVSVLILFSLAVIVPRGVMHPAPSAFAKYSRSPETTSKSNFVSICIGPLNLGPLKIEPQTGVFALPVVSKNGKPQDVPVPTELVHSVRELTAQVGWTWLKRLWIVAWAATVVTCVLAILRTQAVAVSYRWIGSVAAIVISSVLLAAFAQLLPGAAVTADNNRALSSLILVIWYLATVAVICIIVSRTWTADTRWIIWVKVSVASATFLGLWNLFCGVHIPLTDWVYNAPPKREIADRWTLLGDALGTQMLALLAIAFTATLVDPPWAKRDRVRFLVNACASQAALLYAGAFMLVTIILATDSLHRWTAVTLPDDAAKAVGELATANSMGWGIFWTMFLLGLFVPARLVILRDAKQCALARGLNGLAGEAWLKEQGLSSALSWQQMGVYAAMIGPMLAGTVIGPAIKILG